MYGKNIEIEHKGKLKKLWVSCNPDTPIEELKNEALNRLIKFEKLADQEAAKNKIGRHVL